MHADLGRQLGVGDERGQRPFGEPQALVEVGHRREHGGRVEIAEGRSDRSAGMARRVYAGVMA